MPSKTTADLEQEIELLKRQMEIQTAQLRRLSSGTVRAQDAGRRGSCYTNEELKLGMRVAAKIGSGKYTRVKITDIAVFQESGETIYAVTRLNSELPEGKKAYSLGPKWARELFPVEMANSP